MSKRVKKPPEAHRMAEKRLHAVFVPPPVDPYAITAPMDPAYRERLPEQVYYYGGGDITALYETLHRAQEDEL